MVLGDSHYSHLKNTKRINWLFQFALFLRFHQTKAIKHRGQKCLPSISQIKLFGFIRKSQWKKKFCYSPYGSLRTFTCYYFWDRKHNGSFYVWGKKSSMLKNNNIIITLSHSILSLCVFHFDYPTLCSLQRLLSPWMDSENFYF